MKKKLILCLAIICALILSLISIKYIQYSNDKYAFSSEKEMIEFLNGTWENSENSEKMVFGRDCYYFWDSDSFHDANKESISDIDYKNSKFTFSYQKFKIVKNGSLVCQKSIYTKSSDKTELPIYFYSNNLDENTVKKFSENLFSTYDSFDKFTTFKIDDIKKLEQGNFYPEEVPIRCYYNYHYDSKSISLICKFQNIGYHISSFDRCDFLIDDNVYSFKIDDVDYHKNSRNKYINYGIKIIDEYDYEILKKIANSDDVILGRFYDDNSYTSFTLSDIDKKDLKCVLDDYTNIINSNKGKEKYSFN
ncbi:MAG: hypothetical protein ACLU23_04045 [Eubacterium sp.]